VVDNVSVGSHLVLKAAHVGRLAKLHVGEERRNLGRLLHRQRLARRAAAATARTRPRALAPVDQAAAVVARRHHQHLLLLPMLIRSSAVPSCVVPVKSISHQFSLTIN
jgi:hypothetical protein